MLLVWQKEKKKEKKKIIIESVAGLCTTGLVLSLMPVWKATRFVASGKCMSIRARVMSSNTIYLCLFFIEFLTLLSFSFLIYKGSLITDPISESGKNYLRLILYREQCLMYSNCSSPSYLLLQTMRNPGTPAHLQPSFCSILIHRASETWSVFQCDRAESSSSCVDLSNTNISQGSDSSLTFFSRGITAKWKELRIGSQTWIGVLTLGPCASSLTSPGLGVSISQIRANGPSHVVVVKTSRYSFQNWLSATTMVQALLIFWPSCPWASECCAQMPTGYFLLHISLASES